MADCDASASASATETMSSPDTFNDSTSSTNHVTASTYSSDPLTTHDNHGNHISSDCASIYDHHHHDNSHIPMECNVTKFSSGNHVTPKGTSGFGHYWQIDDSTITTLPDSNVYATNDSSYPHFNEFDPNFIQPAYNKPSHESPRTIMRSFDAQAKCKKRAIKVWIIAGFIMWVIVMTILVIYFSQRAVGH